MSQKISSLAIDDYKGHSPIVADVEFTPQLNLIIKKRTGSLRDSLTSSFTTETSEVVSVSGRLIISF